LPSGEKASEGTFIIQLRRKKMKPVKEILKELLSLPLHICFYVCLSGFLIVLKVLSIFFGKEKFSIKIEREKEKSA